MVSCLVRNQWGKWFIMRRCCEKVASTWSGWQWELVWAACRRIMRSAYESRARSRRWCSTRKPKFVYNSEHLIPVNPFSFPCQFEHCRSGSVAGASTADYSIPLSIVLRCFLPTRRRCEDARDMTQRLRGTEKVIGESVFQNCSPLSADHSPCSSLPWH